MYGDALILFLLCIDRIILVWSCRGTGNDYFVRSTTLSG